MVIRCGDSVEHGPTGQTWLVAHVDGDHLTWCGWPDGEAMLSDCTLVRSCSDDEHLKLLNEIAKSSAGRRARVAQTTLAAMRTTEPAP